MNHVILLRQKISSEPVATLVRNIGACAGYNTIGAYIGFNRPIKFEVLNAANLASFEQYQSVRLSIDGAIVHNYGFPK